MDRQKERVKRKKHSRLKIVMGILLILFASLALWACSLFRFDKWHRLEPELITDCERSLMIYDRNGSLICAAGPTKRIWIGLEELTETTVNAFIAAEDLRFYSHDGVDLYRILGAAWADIKAGGYVQGASTISQQLIKLSHLTSDKTMDRKLEEAVLALELESRFEKDEILEMYLNYVYFGGGYYGIEAASLGYYGCHAGELTASQAAQLAGILKSPAAYSPRIDSAASLKRRNSVLYTMYENGFIGKAELDSALSEEYEILSAFPNERSCAIDYAIDEACAILGVGENELTASGYRLYTTIDSGMDEACGQLMRCDACFPSENAQGAMVLLSANGGILAMQGGRGSYCPGSFNRAADIERQPGSLIKPILVYAPALEYGGYTAATVLSDEPMSFGDYTPRNSDEKYYGKVTLRQAVARSLNVPAVYVLSDIGLYDAAAFAGRMGISFEGEDLSLALALGGFTHGVSPLEMCGAYAAIASGGLFIEPTSIERITDENGNTLYERSVSGERVMSRENAYILTSMLQSTASEGTGRRLAETGLRLAAKTGTTIDENGIRDAWCVCYSPEYVAVAWMGTDSASEGSLPKEAVGGNNTALMLGRLFDAIYASKEYPEFTVPEGVSEVGIDTYSLSEGNVSVSNELTPKEYQRNEYFTQGTEPESESGHWISPDPPTELGWSISESGGVVISFVAENRVLTYVLYKKDPFGSVTETARFEGCQGCVVYEDENARSGDTYGYYVVARHPDIKENGLPLSGKPSRELNVTVP